LIAKHIYGLRVPFSLTHLTNGENPARGDLIVFASPRNGTSLDKRLIAIPGDTVALHGEQLIVNGVVSQYVAGNRSELRALLTATRAARGRYRPRWTPLAADSF
jgi:signal peptidase I